MPHSYDDRPNTLFLLRSAALPAAGKQLLQNGMHADFVLGLYPSANLTESEVFDQLVANLAGLTRDSAERVERFVLQVQTAWLRNGVTAASMRGYTRHGGLQQMSTIDDALAVEKSINPDNYTIPGTHSAVMLYQELAKSINVIATLLTKDPAVFHVAEKNRINLHVTFMLEVYGAINRGA